VVGLAEMLRKNRTLEELLWDGNGTTYPGFKAFRDALDSNTALIEVASSDIWQSLPFGGAACG